MKFAVALLVLTLAKFTSANRHLLQNNTLLAPVPAPAPAPGPSNCPAPRDPASGCVAQAVQFQSDCASFVSALNSATGGKVIATTESQIQTLVNGLSTKPSAACCTTATKLLSEACVCDTNVQAVAQQQQKLSPSDFQTVGKVFLTACNKPTCTDTCRLSS